MATDNIGKLLQLFCIVERGDVPIEPSWQSWLVFCLFLIGSTLLAVSGSYFQVRLNIRSAIFCFTLSAAGIGMTLVALLAILLGYYRRRRCRVSNRNDGECLNNARNLVSLDIEKDLFVFPGNSQRSQQWTNPAYTHCSRNAEMDQHRMNPVYANSDQFPYASQNAERNQKPINPVYVNSNKPFNASQNDERNQHQKNPVYVECNQPLHASHKAERKRVELNPMYAERNQPLYAYLAEKNQQRLKPICTDCDKLVYESNIEPYDYEDLVSDYFNSSSETRTCFYNSSSSSEDDDCERESDLGEHYYGRDQSFERMVKQNGRMENERAEDQKMTLSRTTSAKDSIASISRRKSELDLHHKITLLQKPDLRNLRQLSSKSPEDIFFNRNSIPVDGESDCDEDINIQKSSFDSNYVDKDTSPNIVEGNGKKMHLTKCQNHQTGKHKKMRKHQTAINLKSKTPATVKQLDEFRWPKFPNKCQDTELSTTEYRENGYESELYLRNNLHSHNTCSSFCPPKLQEKCLDNNNNLMLLESNQSTVINIDDSQSTVESCNSSFQSNLLLSLNTNKTSMVSGNCAVNVDVSQPTVGGKRWKWSERNEDLRPRIKKRPLLDVNGNPISQYELVKVLSELLIKGQQQLPKHTVEKRNCKNKPPRKVKLDSLQSLKH